MEQTIISDIWNHLNTSIDIILMISIIAVGYILGRTQIADALFPTMRTTLKVLIFAVPLTIVYSYFRETDPGVAIASFFIAFGFHTVVLKFIDKWVKSLSANEK